MAECLKKIRKEYTRENKNLEGLCDIEFCSGCFFIMRSDVFEKIGGFDKRFFMHLEDADLSRQALKYGRVVLDITHVPADVCLGAAQHCRRQLLQIITLTYQNPHRSLGGDLSKMLICFVAKRI